VTVSVIVDDIRPTATTRRRAFATWWARYRALIALVVVACVVAMIVRYVVYPAYSWNRDELTYQWQVSVFRSGHLFGADGGFPNMFWPWLTGQSAQGYFSQYTLGWPLVMFASDLLTGSTTASILVGVVAFVLGAYAFTIEITHDRRLAWLTTALALACPFFAVQSGVYLGYLFSTGIGLLFGTALLAGLRRDDWRLIAAAGALLGYIFLTRPFDAVLWGAAFGAYALVVSWRQWRALFRSAVIVGLAFLPFLVVTVLYNHAITGSFTKFPFTAKDPLDTFGFGVRELMPDTPAIGYSGWEMVRGELRNAFYFPDFLVGAWLGVVVASVGLWLGRRDRSTLGLLAVMLAFPLGYAGFWGIRLSSYYAFLSAPLYFIPAYVPVSLLIGTVILRVWSTRGTALTVVLCAALALATVPYTLWKLSDNHAISEANLAWKHANERVDDDALVFVATQRFLMHLDPYSRNAAQLDNAGALYASDRPRHMLGLIASYPDRTPVLAVTSDPRLGDAFHHPHPDAPTIHLIPMKVLHGRQFAITAQVRATSTKPIVVSMFVDEHYVNRVLSMSPTVGDTYETTFAVGSPTAATANGVVPLRDHDGLVTIRTAQTDNVDQPFTGRFEIQWYSTRPVDDGFELLTPVRKLLVHRDKDDDRVAREVLRIPGFDVDVAPVG
jgi:hypothetical protein